MIHERSRRNHGFLLARSLDRIQDRLARLASRSLSRHTVPRWRPFLTVLLASLSWPLRDFALNFRE